MSSPATRPDRPIRALRLLVASAFGMHVSDQVALVAAPLAAALVFDASAGVIGLLVAGQALGQLLGSIPFGVIVDRSSSRRTIVASTLISIVGFAGAALGLVVENIALFGLSITVAGFGIVLFTLVALSMIPAMVEPNALARTNSRFEIPRALASFAVPLAIGAFITFGNSRWIFAAAVLTAVVALGVTLKLPNCAPTGGGIQRPFAQIVDGGRFVVAQPLLRAITLCSLAWNFAFAVLFVAMVPLLEQFDRDPGMFGTALAFFGLAMICGTWLSGRSAEAIAPKLVLVLGPSTSILAAIMLAASSASSSLAWYCAAFFLLGFGPSMWLVAQNTVRQLVAPRAMLGRVSALIQTAIYGIRPIGAALAGVVISATSPRTGLVAVIVLYVLSTLAVALSGLRSIDSYDDIVNWSPPTEASRTI